MNTTGLIADDEPSVLDVLTPYLPLMGYPVVAGKNGPLLLATIGERRDADLAFKPGFLLTDVEMPGMNGRQLAELVRDQFPGIPVIFMTGDPETIERFSLRAVSDHVLIKGDTDFLKSLLDILAAVTRS